VIKTGAEQVVKPAIEQLIKTLAESLIKPVIKQVVQKAQRRPPPVLRRPLREQVVQLLIKPVIQPVLLSKWTRNREQLRRDSDETGGQEMYQWSQCVPVEGSPRKGVVEGTRIGLGTQRARAFGAALHLQGLRAVAGICEQGWGCRGGRGPSSRSVSGLGEVQDRDLVAQD
jgi:hypothetical protein